MSDLTDLEICKRIAEIEKKEITQITSSCVFVFNDGKSCQYFKEKVYNPLTDDALCFQLMVKHKVSPFVNSDYTSVTNYEHNMTLARDENPNKAICLAIIEANKDK